MSWNDWDDRYQGEEYLFGTAAAVPLQALRDRLPDAGSALAVADGEGRNSVWLARQGFDVTAFDYSTVAIEKARALARQAGVSVDFRQSDIEGWDWGAAGYDLVAAIFIQFAPPDMRSRIFDGLIRATAPGGTLYILGYRPEQVGRGTGGPPHVSHMYTGEILRDAFGALDIEILRGWEEDVDEGPGHRGPSALIEMLARKPG